MKIVPFINSIDAIGQNDIQILITGDFYPGGITEQCCKNGQYEKIFNDTLEILHDKDVSLTNLECPLLDELEPIAKTGMNLSADPVTIEAIKYGKFDVVTLANNHVFDQGVKGISSTLDICRKNNIKTVGTGENLAEALKPLYLEVKGKRIAIINIAEQEFSIATEKGAGAAPLDPVLNYYQIMEAKKNSDIQLVIIHGGYQYHPFPTPEMIKAYRFFADLGVTAIVGHHAHCASGYEYYHGVPIFYNLGNFVFDLGKARFPSWYEGYFIKLVLRENKVYQAQLYPYCQNKESSGVSLMPQEQEETYWEKIQSYCDAIDDPKKIQGEFQKMCGRIRKGYLLSLMNAPWIFRKLARRKLLPEFFVRKSKKFWLPYLNKLRCPAHRETTIEILKKEIGVDE